MKKSWKLPPFDDAEGALLAGEPYARRLLNFRNDRGLTCDSTHICCACGFKHILVTTVFQANEKWYTMNRWYPLDDTKPYKVYRKKPRAKAKRKRKK